MQKKKQHGGGVAAGVGLAALAAAAAGAYFLYGTETGKKRRKAIESWMFRMRADVIDRMEKMKDWSEKSYNELVDSVAEKYKNVKNIDKAELMAVVDDLKKHWKSIRKQVESGTKSKTSSPRRKKPAKSAPKSPESM
jgi:hypothetical protein